LPSFCWGIINAIILSAGKYIVHHEIDILYSLNLVFTGMWFLTVLFILNVIGTLIEKLHHINRYIIWLVLFIFLYFSPSFWMRNQLLYLLPFFVGSFEFGKYNWKSPLWLGVISLCLFVIVLFYFYSFDVSLYKMTDDVLSVKYHFNSLIRYFLGFTGCISSIFICKYLFVLPVVSKIIMGIGKKTLPIYVLHQFILLPNLYIQYSTNNHLSIFIFSLLLLYLSILLYTILQKQRFLKLYLFGETK
jgi:fucose 4-O-acetylase-like acetyltransferase